jgi:hypothetical protein
VPNADDICQMLADICGVPANTARVFVGTDRMSKDTGQILTDTCGVPFVIPDWPKLFVFVTVIVVVLAVWIPPSIDVVVTQTLNLLKVLIEHFSYAVSLLLNLLIFVLDILFDDHPANISVASELENFLRRVWIDGVIE